LELGWPPRVGLHEHVQCAQAVVVLVWARVRVLGGGLGLGLGLGFGLEALVVLDAEERRGGVRILPPSQRAHQHLIRVRARA
jgi:hypothetical protein